MTKTFYSMIADGPGKIKQPCVDVPVDIGDELATGASTRVIAVFEGGLDRHSALRRSRDGYFFITLSKSFLKDLKKELGEEVCLSLRLDDSKYGMPIIEEWQAFMDQDPEVREKFESLKTAHIRGYLHYLGNPKTETGRINRCVDFAQKLMNGGLHADKA